MTQKILPLFFLSLTIFVSGCGGGSMATPPVASQTPESITAAQVFNASMIGQTWTFVNGYGDHTFIAIESAPFCVFGVCDGKSATMHFTKDNARAYLCPGVQCELWFYLHLDSDNAWRSLGWEMIQDGVYTSSSISLLAGWTAAPYTIIPASSDSPAINTAYLGTRQDGLTTNSAVNVLLTWTAAWTTFSIVEDVTTPLTGKVRALRSKQCEGGTPGACDFIVELWYFCPNVGLCAITPSAGLNGALDPKLAIVRIN
jgi:hypothetical protein